MGDFLQEICKGFVAAQCDGNGWHEQHIDGRRRRRIRSGEFTSMNECGDVP